MHSKSVRDGRHCIAVYARLAFHAELTRVGRESDALSSAVVEMEFVLANRRDARITNRPEATL